MPRLWILILLLCILAALPSHAALTCPWAWDPVITDTAGQPLAAGRLLGYALWSKATGLSAYPPQPAVRLTVGQFTDPAMPRWSLPCDRGQTWAVTAYDALGDSGLSNEVVLPLAPVPAQRFRIEGTIILIPEP
jgi:hypothetical protein